MTTTRFLLGAATVLTALLLQTAVLPALPLPGAPPELCVVLVVAFALAEGPLSGAVTGFVAGLGADLLSDHELGRLALAYALVGAASGQVGDESERPTLTPFAVVAAAATGAVLLFAGEGLLLGDPRVSGEALARSLTSAVPYAVLLTPLVVPVVAALVRRLDPEGDDLERLRR